MNLTVLPCPIITFLLCPSTSYHKNFNNLFTNISVNWNQSIGSTESKPTESTIAYTLFSHETDWKYKCSDTSSWIYECDSHVNYSQIVNCICDHDSWRSYKRFLDHYLFFQISHRTGKKKKNREIVLQTTNGKLFLFPFCQKSLKMFLSTIT